jgi:hypothetical protein
VCIPENFFSSYYARDKYQRDLEEAEFQDFARMEHSGNPWRTYQSKVPVEKMALTFRWKYRDDEDLDAYAACWEAYGRYSWILT